LLAPGEQQIRIRSGEVEEGAGHATLAQPDRSALLDDEQAVLVRRVGGDEDRA
jgi:hypothetical protein